jgi:DNA-binding XRE family transcriptional regulator
MPAKKEITWIVNENGCHICTSHSLKGNGYPTIQINKIRRRISNIVYENNFEKIPKGMVICHSCDTPACINSAHLFLGSNADNTRDKVKKNRQSRLKGEKNKNSKINETTVKEIRLSKDSAKILAKKYGVGRSQITRIRNGDSWGHIKENILKKGENHRGEKNSQAKLTEKQIKEIRAIKDLSQDKIAKIYGISQTTISEIRLNKTWKHLKGVAI